MLVGKGFIPGQVVVAPAEMGGLRKAGPGPRASGNRIHMDRFPEQPFRCQGQQGQLNGCGETARVRDILSLLDGLLLGFRQPVNEFPLLEGIAGFQSEFIAEVNYPGLFAELPFGQELSGIPMPEAEEDHVHFPVSLVGERQVCAPEKVRMGMVEGGSGTGTAVDKLHSDPGMAQQKPDEFAPCISGTSYDSRPDHFS